MVDSYSAGGVVLNAQGQVLVVNQNGDSWSLPKGHKDPEEVPLETAKREIYEESGISQLEYIRDLGTYQRFRYKQGIENKEVRKNITMFLFRTNQIELKPVDPENPEARWVDKDKVVELLSFPKDKEFFQGVLNQYLNNRN